MAPRRLLFWPERAPENKQIYDLYGIERRGWETDGLSMIITNASEQRIEIRFENHLQNEKWNLEMLTVAQGLREMQDLLRQEGVKPSNVGMEDPSDEASP